ncbi:MAG TPA: MerR family transcriptional regulator [Gemmatimonadaceae bacterium]
MKQLRSKKARHRTPTGQHPIAVVAKRTGLSQDVLRVWERRYDAVKPTRGSNGQRFYTDADVDRLRVLHAATSAGRSIGQVVKLSDKALNTMVEGDAAARATLVATAAESSDAATVIEAALVFTRSLEAARLNDHLSRAAAVLGVPDFFARVAVPLLHRVGDEWHAGRLATAQEHLASSVLHDIFVGSMRACSAQADAPGVLIATPAGERHVIGAALVGAAAAVDGWTVVYLGADLPAKEISAAAIASDVRAVALSIVYVDDRRRVVRELRTLRSLLPAGIALFVGGSGALSLSHELSGSGIRVTDDVAELYEELRRGK